MYFLFEGVIHIRRNKQKIRKLSVKPIAAAAYTMLLLTILGTGVNASDGGKVTLNSGTLNVRSAPSVNGEIVSSLPNGSYVTLESENGGWWYAEYDGGKYGYLSSRYIEQLDGNDGTVVTSGGHLNVRTGPGVSYPAFDALPHGKDVVVINENNGWGLVLYDGDTSGYVNLNYISYSGDLGSSQLYKSVSLDVVSFKQYDNRWGEMYVGSSGRKVKNIGCTLTCVAMSESYRTGSVTTPAQVVQSSRFTSGGALYWPSNYVKDYSSDYLSAIYYKLLEGKPVIIETKNRYGTSHWVLVTGYTGGNTLTPSGFIINDPGFENRTTLAQHMTYYPYYSKLVYYTQ